MNVFIGFRERKDLAKKTAICPGLAPFQRRVSAALRSRDASSGRASLSNPK